MAHKRKNGRFAPNKVYFSPSLVKRYGSMGKIHLYALYTLLRHEYASGHFHGCAKPSWYTKSQQSFYRELSELFELGLVRKQHGSFNTVSLFKLTGGRHENFAPTAKIITEKNVNELINHFKDLIVRWNYLGQLKNICIKTLGFTWDDLILSKAKRKEYRKLYNHYNSSQAAFQFTKQDSDHRTSLGCSRCGELFGRSAWYGWSIFKSLIKEKKVLRFIYKIPVHINYTKSTLPYLIKKYSDLRFYKGMFYKIYSTFMFTSTTYSQYCKSIYLQ